MVLSYLALRHDEWVKMARKFSIQADDVLQDAYIKLYDRFKDDPNSLKVMHPNQVSMYVYLTIRSIAINESKQDLKTTELSEDIPEEYEESKEEIYRAIEKEIDSFHWYDQKLLKLYFEKNMSMREIEREIEISLASVCYTIKTCKERIKEKVKQKL